ncbi:putative MFS family arabinose efflux permease [Paucimonas lemoignei]|uniref:Putative MFS family arabinose efflux permease n=1 Tax=Paucimonas lemoignei TaxID=29443 RepID=A0A4R3HSW1_PAULE|nr:MFS transporter [Paucimonas lemoignei]TCS36266.1 putative MFS family arabinose efflux permease [Paucimonas lemoignei]
MSTASVKTVLPLSLLTGASVLAMDFYLPAVPNLQASFGIDVTLAQATITLFLAGLAASQLLWADLLTRLGPRKSVQIGIWLLVATNIACALSSSIEVLLLMRLIQGIAAGSAMVVAPSVVRATLSDESAVRGIAMISMVEAIIPAAGPVLGAALLGYTDWRGTFWVLGLVTLLVLPFVTKVTPHELPGMDRSVNASYAAVLGKSKYRRLAISHALSFGALITFVASAPQLMVNALGLGASAFPMLQLLGVSSFIIMASQSGRISKRLGVPAAIQLGACVQAALCAVMLLASLYMPMSFAAIAAFWCAFCGGLAVRGPATFSEVLALPPAQMGRASGLLTLAVLVAGACGTQLAAPYMDGKSASPLLGVMLTACLLSLAAVLPFPRTQENTSVATT